MMLNVHRNRDREKEGKGYRCEANMVLNVHRNHKTY